MTAVTFSNDRLDPGLTPFHALAEQLANAFGYTAELTIDRRLAELVRLRVAQLTPCSYCLILHTRVAMEYGVRAEKVAHLASWRESGMFDDRERAALAYCEGLTNYDLAGFAQLHETMSTLFTPVEVSEFAAVIINMNVWTRLKLAEGATPRELEEGSRPAGD